MQKRAKALAIGVVLVVIVALVVLTARSAAQPAAAAPPPSGVSLLVDRIVYDASENRLTYRVAQAVPVADPSSYTAVLRWFTPQNPISDSLAIAASLACTDPDPRACAGAFRPQIIQGEVVGAEPSAVVRGYIFDFYVSGLGELLLVKNTDF
jgi:hypothetical protein